MAGISSFAGVEGNPLATSTYYWLQDWTRAYHALVGRAAAIVLALLAMVATVVCVDVLFFRHHFTERLIANVGIVLVFGAIYAWFARPRAGDRPRG